MKLKKLKLNALSEAGLKDKEMNAQKGVTVVLVPAITKENLDILLLQTTAKVTTNLTVTLLKVAMNLFIAMTTTKLYHYLVQESREKGYK